MILAGAIMIPFLFLIAVGKATADRLLWTKNDLIVPWYFLRNIIIEFAVSRSFEIQSKKLGAPLNPSHPNTGRREEINFKNKINFKKKINKILFSLLFVMLLKVLKPFEAPQRSVKSKTLS